MTSTSLNRKLLTIAIPTWNRSFYLNGLLSDLTAQIIAESLHSKIEILISDNNSTDETFDIVTSYLNQSDNIIYSRNDSNIGAKSNVIKAMELAAGHYVLLIGDDDRIRKGSLTQLIKLIERHNSEVLIDIGNFRKKVHTESSNVSLNELLLNYYWLIGNAGHYVIKTDSVRHYVMQFGYSFFNECWPHTQLIILVLSRDNKNALLTNLKILSEGMHGELMIYSSLYLWRTCYYELLLSINTLKPLIGLNEYNAARKYMLNSLPQQLFNILQCGIFIDSSSERKATAIHIKTNRKLFTFYEKSVLLFISIVLGFPVWISRPCANLFILLMKGKNGLRKKNNFVNQELAKKTSKRMQHKAIRKLDFEA